MEQHDGHHRRMYHDRHYAQPSHQARPSRQQHRTAGHQQNIPSSNMSPASQQQQNRPRPGPGRFPVNPDTRPKPRNLQHGPIAAGDALPFEPPRPAFHPSSRHMSHISELSSTYAASDSRPVSVIGSEPEFSHSMSNYRLETPPSSYTGHNAPQQKLPHLRQHQYSLPLRDSETLPRRDDNSTMAALSAAIRAGLTPGQAVSETNPKELPLRMPFQGEPESPTSIYTDTTTSRGHASMPFSAYRGHQRQESKVSTISEQEGEDFEKSPRFMSEDPKKSHYVVSGGYLPASRLSDTLVAQSDQSGLSSRIPEGKRPPRLDMGAVREAEARGSMTSLSDLIRRATRVASNLDRGRTASRLGHLDMFGSSDKLDRMKGRNSTYSDVLAAFPAPTENGTPGRERPNTMWPNEKNFAASKSSLGRFVENADGKPKRRCCGLSPPLFVLILVTLVLLVVAAVLIPIFLIVIPRQNHSQDASTHCPASHTCNNGGTSVFSNNVCSCICVDGFTGSDCTSQTDPDCGTGTFIDGSKTWDNATLGNAVLPVLQTSVDTYGLPLNSTLILSKFAYNNLSCVSENSLVQFGNGGASQRRRWTVLPGSNPDTFEADLRLPAGEQPISDPTQTLELRQEATQSSNGIVFAHSSTAPTNIPTSSVGLQGTATSTSSIPAATSATVQASEEQVNFAGAVVLYVLQSFPDINVAVSSKQAIAAHFGDKSSSNGTVEIVSGSQGLQADFDNFQIIFANGTRLGHD